MNDVERIREKFTQIKHSLDERGRREWAAAEAIALGYGGIKTVHLATGIVPSTIGKGIREIKSGSTSEPTGRRIRKTGGGRRKVEDVQPNVLQDLESLVEPLTRGDPESPLRWVSRSLRRLAKELQNMGYRVGRDTVHRLLKTLGYSLQANRKTKEGSNNPDRNAQFDYINERTKQQIANGNPAISVDTKKKELIGNYKNGGREYRPKGQPEEVNVYDFKGKLGKAVPYGVYDITENAAWVSVGISGDTAEFSVEAIHRWWLSMGSLRYPGATELLITADCGGSNGYRTRLWKLELQNLADVLGIPITVCHFPPGTSKWNKIEHRLFSFITMNWRGKPLVDYMTVIELIAATTTEEGLEVRCELDDNTYETGKTVSDQELAMVNIQRHEFHGEWNYTIRPW